MKKNSRVILSLFMFVVMFAMAAPYSHGGKENNRQFSRMDGEMMGARKRKKEPELLEEEKEILSQGFEIYKQSLIKNKIKSAALKRRSLGEYNGPVIMYDAWPVSDPRQECLIDICRKLSDLGHTSRKWYTGKVKNVFDRYGTESQQAIMDATENQFSSYEDKVDYQRNLIKVVYDCIINFEKGYRDFEKLSEQIEDNIEKNNRKAIYEKKAELEIFLVGIGKTVDEMNESFNALNKLSNHLERSVESIGKKLEKEEGEDSLFERKGDFYELNKLCNEMESKFKDFSETLDKIKIDKSYDDNGFKNKLADFYKTFGEVKEYFEKKLFGWSHKIGKDEIEKIGNGIENIENKDSAVSKMKEGCVDGLFLWLSEKDWRSGFEDFDTSNSEINIKIKKGVKAVFQYIESIMILIKEDDTK
jgi:hypothetical protein